MLNQHLAFQNPLANDLDLRSLLLVTVGRVHNDLIDLQPLDPEDITMNFTSVTPWSNDFVQDDPVNHTLFELDPDIRPPLLWWIPTWVKVILALASFPLIIGLIPIVLSSLAICVAATQFIGYYGHQIMKYFIPIPLLIIFYFWAFAWLVKWFSGPGVGGHRQDAGAYDLWGRLADMPFVAVEDFVGLILDVAKFIVKRCFSSRNLALAFE